MWLFSKSAQLFATVFVIFIVLVVSFFIGHYLRSKYFEHNTGDPFIKYTVSQFFKSLLLGLAIVLIGMILAFLVSGKFSVLKQAFFN